MALVPRLVPLVVAMALAGCSPTGQESAHRVKTEPAALLQQAEQELAQLDAEANRAQWIYENYITTDTATLASEANLAFTQAAVRHATAAAKLDPTTLSPLDQRKLSVLLRNLILPAPSDEAKSQRLAELDIELNRLYSTGRFCMAPERCLSLPQLSTVMDQSRDPDELLQAWVGWRSIAPPMRPLFAEQVSLANEGAEELGFDDVGQMWRSQYDMPADQFAERVDALWLEVKPLYEALHCYVRGELGEVYGDEVVSQSEPIPAHLLGNMWAQQWSNVYDLVAPEDLPGPGYDLTLLLSEHGYDELKMVQQAERFFTSMGFAPLPDTFWQRSLFVEPQDRDVVCHASAWDLDNREDLRIKMCIQRTGEDFRVIHHELGHNIYQRAYQHQPFLFKESANDGFHEAIGDVISLSITPAYLKQIGLLEKEPPAESDIGLLLREAMEKVAFLPFGLLVDQWRWQVFSGEIAPSDYNQAWWDLRLEYQGVAPPVPRSELDFDPGAKYHVPTSVPYTRYFLAHLLQFQLFEALCKEAGHQGPIHRCTLYGSREAGEKLDAMLKLGLSQPWPQALALVTGEEQMSGQAMLNYFAPLKDWLNRQNAWAGRRCGW